MHFQWPVGLKNVGQTCWFSAVIQSLFYLPAFRTLVLNYDPPTEQQRKEEAQGSSSYDVERQRKIVEFMQELRKLFALMVATQRKYVDPTRAVDILRGSIGSIVETNTGDNNQQDVSEFTHIVLEWVEEAFKRSEAKMEMSSDQEKENNEEKEEEDDSDPKNINPMSRLFYGKVLIEGFVHGAPFVRSEAFGQWPLQVNSYSDIHESIEGSTAHELFDGGDAQPAAGQERWFTQLPPVLFFELSRFHYNTERKAAEKIHNRLDFPEVIYMDRYMKTNKTTTRQKREEVRALKERRALLKARLDQFSNYGGGQLQSAMALPDVLQLTLDFAGAPVEAAIPAHLKDVNMHSPSDAQQQQQQQQQQQPMMVDSPCHSPKVTPAPSLANISSEDGMDVEMSESKESSSNGCDVLSDAMVSQKPPCPRHISEVEFRVLQVGGKRFV